MWWATTLTISALGDATLMKNGGWQNIMPPKALIQEVENVKYELFDTEHCLSEK